jgi:outer membrane cobalamin receptor
VLTRFTTAPALFLCTALVSPGALAQTVNSGADVIDEVIVVGRRTVNSSLATQGSALSPDFDYSMAHDGSFADILDQTPGVSLNGQGGQFQTYSLRGYSRGRIRTEIDGMAILTDRRAGNSIAFLPSVFVERTNVYLGSAASLYGSGAMGGVVSVDTRLPKQHVLSVGLGSSGAFRELSAAVALNDEIGLIASHTERNNSKAPNGESLAERYERSAALLKSRRAIGDKASLEYTLIASHGAHIGKSSGLYPETQQASYPADNHRLANVSLSSGDLWAWRAYWHQQRWSTDTLRSDRQNFSQYEADTLGSLVYRSHNWLGGRGKSGLEYLARQNVDTVEQELSSTGEVSFDTNVLAGHSNSTGAFIEQAWSMSAVDLTLGARADLNELNGRNQDRSFTTNSLSASLAWALSETTQTNITLGNAFRHPTLSELYFSGDTPRGQLLGNPDLAQEKSRSLTWSIDHDSTRFRVNASVYFHEIDQFIERYRIDETRRSYRNLAKGELWGFDGGWLFEPNDRLAHRLSTQWQQGQGPNGAPLADLNLPEIRYSGSYRLNKLAFIWVIAHRLTRNSAGPDELPVSNATRLQLGVSFQQGKWHFNLSAINASNELMRRSADEDAPWAMERNLVVTAEWRPGT